jgi:hypothetical protein
LGMAREKLVEIVCRKCGGDGKGDGGRGWCSGCLGMGSVAKPAECVREDDEVLVSDA